MDEILNREVAVIEDLFEDFVEKANQGDFLKFSY